MPLYSDHISNMYYSGSPSYTSSPYSYSSAVSPYGSSYSASYLNPGGNYSSHSSFGGYSRTPLSTRWLTSGGRAYSPMLSSISEKGTSSPVRINSPRRIPISGRSYVSSPYTSRPININTADIDVSQDKYRNKVQSPNARVPSSLPPRRASLLTNKENGLDKPDTGIDTSPGPRRSTIKRDRTVVRLHTVKRKERDSPRKPTDVLNNATNNDSSITEVAEKQTESKKWREKLADDLAYKTQKEKKTLGAKLVEKFTLKEKVDDEYDNCTKTSPKNHINKEKSPVKQNTDDVKTNNSVDRRCSMELLAEQACLLDSLIRRENLSIAPLDISKVGAKNILTTGLNLEPKNTIKLANQKNRLSTTKSDHSLHDHLSTKNIKDHLLPKRRSLRKCSSGGSICKLDCITEIPKKTTFNLSSTEDKNKKLKPKIKTKITSTVEVTPTTPQLKFIVENITVEEKSRPCKKDIIFSSTLDETQPLNTISTENDSDKECIKLKKPQVDIQVDSGLKHTEYNDLKGNKLLNENLHIKKGHRKSIKLKSKENSKPQLENSGNLTSPEPEDGNFWEKIGKRETVYLINRKQNLEKAKQHNKQSLSWFPDGEETVKEVDKNISPKLLEKTATTPFVNIINETNVSTGKSIKEENVNLKELQEIAYVNNDLHSEKILNEPETKKNISGGDNLVTSSDFITFENTNTTFSKTNESDKHSKNKTKNLDELESLNSNDQEIQVTEHIVEPKLLSCKIENIAKDTKSINKSNDMKANVVVHEKCLSEENSVKKKNISILQANHSVEGPKTNNEGSFGTINSEKTFEYTNAKTSQKDEIDNKTTTSIKINAVTVFAADNSPESLNIPDKTVESSINKSPKQTNQQMADIDKLKAEKQNEVPISPHSRNETTVNIENTSIASNKEDKIEPSITNPKSSHSDNFDNKTTISIKKNTGTVLNAATNALLNLNISNSKVIAYSINESPTLINNQTSEIDELTAEKQKDVLISSNSGNEKTVNIENTTIASIKEDKIEPLTTNANIEFITTPDNQDSTTHLEEKYADVASDKRENDIDTGKLMTNTENQNKPVTSADVFKVFTDMRPAKEEKALKPLIATPRPLQKRNPQSIRSSSSSSSSSSESSDDDSSGEDTKEDGDKDEGESGSSHGECENNPDGRISTGSNDSGFDSSAPTSPSGFLHAKKGGGSPSTSAGITPPQSFTHDTLEQELEHSTAYDLFRKTGRFTPPARTIPRFRKYTIDDFQFIRVLGKGSFGKVMLAELRDTEYYYAVKCLKKDVVLEDDDVECTLIERKVLALGTNHPYLCHLFATFQTDSHLFFVMEYLNGGDLMFHIQQSGRFPEVKARFYAAEIVSGLKFLHKRGIVYRDLKLDNILLDFDGHVRIADFGMCKLQIYLDKTADTFCGTPDYMAPEIIRGLKYNQTVDWWSFGVLLYEMLIGQSPFSGCDEDELFWSICNEMPSYPRFLSPESLSILTRLLDKDAKTRLGGPECMHGDIREQKFFEQIQWDRLERRELEAPFKPRVRHPMDTQYFDRAFTGERPRLTTVEPQVLRSMDQEPFRGFSYTNPNATDR